MKPAEKDKIIKKDIIFVKCITFTLGDIMLDILPELRKEIKNYWKWKKDIDYTPNEFLDYLEEKYAKKNKKEN